MTVQIDSKQPQAGILPRSKHCISRSHIDPDALKVLYRLHRSGHAAYLVGGSVRDLLLGRTPRDFDIGTDAHPGRLRRLFRNCRIIGRRFKLAHILFQDNKIIEVATFRRHAEAVASKSQPARPEFNTFGTAAEDALRRDITINGLFYDIATFSVIDYVGGLQDLKNRCIRTIKNPTTSFTEDPIRIVRVMRHAARTGFRIEPETWNEVMARHKTVMTCSMDRLREEFYKDLSSMKLAPLFEIFHASGFLYTLFPEFELRGPGRLPERIAFLHRLLDAAAAIDRCVATSLEPPTPSLLLAMLLMPYFSMNAWRTVPKKDLHLSAFLHERLDALLAPLLHRIKIPHDLHVAIFQTVIICEKIRQAVYSRGSIPHSLYPAQYFQQGLALYRADLESRGETRETVDQAKIASDDQRHVRRRRRRKPEQRAPAGDHHSQSNEARGVNPSVHKD